MRTLFVAALCFGMLAVASATGFSAQYTQSNGQSLSNGANQAATPGTVGGSWSTNNLGGFTDGQFQSDGGYIIPVGGIYHFDATLQVELATASNSAPDQTVDLRIVKCANGCNAFCTGGSDVAATLVQGGTIYLATPFDAAVPPTYSISASFSGTFNTGDLIGLCIDSQAASGAVKLQCVGSSPTCLFSGFSA